MHVVGAIHPPPVLAGWVVVVVGVGVVVVVVIGRGVVVVVVGPGMVVVVVVVGLGVEVVVVGLAVVGACVEGGAVPNTSLTTLINGNIPMLQTSAKSS